MEQIRSLLVKKPPFFLIGTLVYILFLYLLRWNIHPTLDALWFIIGSIIGMYVLETAEEFFHLTPSPFRSMLFVGFFILVSFFVLSSSGSFLASGIVLSTFLTLLFWQIGEWMVTHHLHRWYAILADPVAPRTQFVVLLITIVLFIFETIIFIRMPTV